MVLGSRPITDLSHDHTDPNGMWEASLLNLLDEIALLRGGTSTATPSITAQGSGCSSDAPAGGSHAQASVFAAAAHVPPPPASGARTGFEGLTMAQKAARVRAELGLDGSLPIARLVQEANAAMGIEGSGPLAKQVETLMVELGVM